MICRRCWATGSSLQGVMLNLAINGIETMLEIRDESWEPLVSSERRKGSDAGGGLVAIENAGVGFDRADAERLFAS
jgi:hypothetical protein